MDGRWQGRGQAGHCRTVAHLRQVPLRLREGCPRLPKCNLPIGSTFIIVRLRSNDVRRQSPKGTVKMRLGLTALISVGFLTASAAAALARDGCSYDAWGRLYCKPGARPGQPYYGPSAPPPYYRGGYYPAPQPRYRRYKDRNPCPPNWTVQSGVCKPYRGF
jgi:hypothetical protein